MAKSYISPTVLSRSTGHKLGVCACRQVLTRIRIALLAELVTRQNEVQLHAQAFDSLTNFLQGHLAILHARRACTEARLTPVAQSYTADRISYCMT